MNIIFEELKQKVVKIKDKATERSYYPLLCEFIVDYAKSGAIKLINPSATPEETSKQYENRVGFPDITVRNGVNLVGCIEVKKPEENLNSEKFNEQFNKYKDSLENIIFTNLREWQLWQWVKKEDKDQPEPTMIAQTIFDLTTLDDFNSADFEQLLERFLEGRSFSTRTPKQLALALAKKTQFLSKQVEEALDENAKEADLTKLKETFEKTLIQNIKPHQFSNMVSETMAYSLFLASLEHAHRGNGSDLTLTNAIDYLPTNVPILADLYSLIKKVATTIPNIFDAAQLLVDQLNASEIERIRQKLVDHKPGEDPVIQFYEPFLKEYDPEEKKDRGVFYTPKPVVDYIIRSVDWILRNKFNKEQGLADKSVNLLDPATGTGTFIMSAVQEIHKNVKRENTSLGNEMVTREFNKVVLDHILKHFYGFELLVAPYAIAHLKLTLEVERLGFDFASTKNDNDSDNDRFKIYLANTLDDPRGDKDSRGGVGQYESWIFSSIPEESKAARKVKNEIPILVITGNPPYSISSLNMGDWIKNLTEIYKKDLDERNINALSDDYVKFIRFAQWKLEKTGQGILAMITSNTFIDGTVHRQMRRSLMDTFDDIFIYNLHGNSRAGETSPDGKKDENVFDIQQGVSINIFIKSPKKQGATLVNYNNLWGSRESKFATLLSENFDQTSWKKLSPTSPNWFFSPKNVDREAEYSLMKSTKEIFPLFGSGIKFRKDSLLVKNHFSKRDVVTMINDINNEDVNVLLKYDFKETPDWKLVDKKRLFVDGNDSDIKQVQYRPFDFRYAYYPTNKIGEIIPRGDSRINLMKQMLNENLGLIVTRINRQASLGYFSVTKNILDLHFLDTSKDSMVLAPLYVYNENNQSNIFEKIERKPNISFQFIQELSQKIGLKFISNGQGNLKTTFGPEDFFYYVYSILYSQSYRDQYSEQLKNNFPHLPITGDVKLFQRLVYFGKELVNLHLLGENPFDKSKTIFGNQDKWKVRIGGSKPENIPDWKVEAVHYDEKKGRVYVNKNQYFEGIEKDIWNYMIGGYQVCERWLDSRKNVDRCLSTEDLKHFMKMVIALRETIRIQQEIDKAIPEWPIK